MMKPKLLAQMMVFLGLCCLLSGCVTSLWTGASLVYDRHNVYKKVTDFQLSAAAQRALFKDQVFKCQECVLDIAVFNRDLLLAGHVPNTKLRAEAQRRLDSLTGYRRKFYQLGIAQEPGHTVEDTWITTKIRSLMIADADINPKQFKVVTSDGIVYLMGDVLPKQADRVILIARETTGVRRVVKLLKYYHLRDTATLT